MKNKIIYSLIIAFSSLPFTVLYSFSNFLAFILNHVISYRKDVVTENLRNSFPDKTNKEIDDLRVQFIKNFSDQMVETLKMFTISDEDLKERLVIDTPSDITDWLEKGRSVMMGAPHFGNWEYPAGFPNTIPGFDGYNIVYAPIENVLLNKRIKDNRERWGCNLITMRDTFREILSQPNHGQAYGFLFDQSPHKSKVKHDLMFMNQLTPVHLGTEQVAVKKNAVVIYIEVYRVKRGFYRMKSKLITDSPKDLPEFEITNQLFANLENSINRDPAQWLWSHRRWKYKAGRDYNLVK